MKYFFHTPCRFIKLYYLCNAFQIKSHAHKILVRLFSWLEYMPVTHGVASSSLVRTANKQYRPLIFRGFFVFRHKIRHKIRHKNFRFSGLSKLGKTAFS